MVVELDAGRPAESLAAADRATELADRIWDADRSNLDGSLDLGIALRRGIEALAAAGRHDEVLRRSERAFRLLDPLEKAGNARAVFEHAIVEAQLGRSYAGAGNRAEGLRHLRRAVEMLEREHQSNPGDTQRLDELARARLSLGEAQIGADPAAACAEIRRAMEAWNGMKAAGELRYRSRAPMTRTEGLLSKCR